MRRMVSLAAAAVAGVALLLWFAWSVLATAQRSVRPTVYYRHLVARLPGRESIEYGVWRDLTDPLDRASHCCVRWHRRDGVRQYVLSVGDTLRVDIRATPDYRGIWLVDASGGNWVVASLDRETGEFLDLNCVLIDPRLSLDEQERQFGQHERPEWATPDGGILLAKWPD